MNNRERKYIQSLLAKLNRQPAVPFPDRRERLPVPNGQGVYIICKRNGRAVHVGRSVRGRSGLHQRLTNHLRGKSSFARVYLRGNGERLRQGFSYRYLAVPNDRARALLEYAATVWHCPAHLGLGTKKART